MWPRFDPRSLPTAAIRLGSVTKKKSTASRSPGTPTVRKAICHGASAPMYGRTKPSLAFAHVSTAAPSSAARALPTEMALE